MFSGRTFLTRRRGAPRALPGVRSPEDAWRDVPHVYEGVAEALVAGRSPVIEGGRVTQEQRRHRKLLGGSSWPEDHAL